MKSPLVLLIVLALASSACRNTGESSNDPAPEITTSWQAELDQAWSVCVICHGDTGEGDGPASVNLKTKPRSFGLPEWQEATTDAALRSVILEGGAAVGLSGLMPSHARLRDKPEVVDGLVAKIRSFNP